MNPAVYGLTRHPGDSDFWYRIKFEKLWPKIKYLWLFPIVYSFLLCQRLIISHSLIKINPMIVLYFFNKLVIRWAYSQSKPEFFIRVADKEVTSLIFFYLILLLLEFVPVLFHLLSFANFYSLIRSLIILTYYFPDFYIQFCVTCKFDSYVCYLFIQNFDSILVAKVIPQNFTELFFHVDFAQLVMTHWIIFQPTEKPLSVNLALIVLAFAR